MQKRRIYSINIHICRDLSNKMRKTGEKRKDKGEMRKDKGQRTKDKGERRNGDGRRKKKEKEKTSRQEYHSRKSLFYYFVFEKLANNFLQKASKLESCLKYFDQ